MARRVSFIVTARNDGFVKALDQSAKRMDRFGRKMKRQGRSMTQFITAPALAAGGAAVKMASDFEASLSKMEGLVGLARSEVQGMRDDVLALAGQTAQAPQDLADALFFVTSAGLRGSDALEVLEASAKAASAGLGETKVVADLVTSAMNAYGSENLSAAQATDVLVAAVREGKAEADSLAQSMGQVLPVASELGVEFDQVGAAIAAMTRTGTGAEVASTQLRQILVGLLKPAAGAEEAMRKMGTSSAGLRKVLREDGLVEVLGFLREQMSENEQAMSQVFPNVRALSGALDIMGSNAEENVQIFDRMTDTTGSLDEAFEAASDTTRFKINQALSEMRVQAIALGEILLPVARNILDEVIKLSKWFGSLSTETQTTIVKNIALAAAIGPVLIGFGSMIRTVASLIKIFTSLSGIVGTLAAGLTGLAGAGAIGLGGLIVLIQRSVSKAEEFRDVLKEALNMKPEGTEDELTKVTNAISSVSDKIQEARRGMRDYNREATKIEIEKLENQALKLAQVRDRIIDMMQAQAEGNATNREAERIQQELNDALAEQEEALAGSSEEQKGLNDLISDNEKRYDDIMNKIGELTDAEIAEAIAIQRTNDYLREQIRLRKVQADPNQMGQKALPEGRTTEDMVEGILQRAAAAKAGVEQVDTATQSAAQSFVFFETMAGQVFDRLLFGAEKLQDVLKSIVRQLASRAVMQGLKLLVGGGAFTIGGFFKSVIGVNDALIKSDGSVVQFHPDDNILAMKDFSGIGGGGVIHNYVYLDGREVFRNQKRIENDRLR